MERVGKSPDVVASNEKIPIATSSALRLSHAVNSLPQPKVFSFFSFFLFFCLFPQNQVLFRSLAKLPTPTAPPEIIPLRAVIGRIGLHRLCSVVRGGLTLQENIYVLAFQALPPLGMAQRALSPRGGRAAGLPAFPGSLAICQETRRPFLLLCGFPCQGTNHMVCLRVAFREAEYSKRLEGDWLMWREYTFATFAPFLFSRSETQKLTCSFCYCVFFPSLFIPGK